MVLSALLVLTPLHPRPEVPAVGAEVDQSFEIALPDAVAGPAVRVTAAGATILIARRVLEELAAKDATSWKSEAERLTQIAAGRAKKLLLQVSSGAAGSAAPVDAAALGDAQYLLAQILEAGKAAVIPAGSETAAGRIVVRYSGTHPGPTVGFGLITFSLQQPARVFFTISWFAS